MNPNNEPNDKDENIDIEEEDQVGELNEEDEELIDMKNVIEVDEIDKGNQMNCDDEEQPQDPIPQEYPEFKAKGEIYSLALNEETGIIIMGDGENNTTFYDIAKKQIIASYQYNSESVNFLKFSNDGKYLVSSSVNGHIIIFDVKNNYAILSEIKDNTAEVNWLEWHPKGPAFAFGSSDGSVWLYKANAIENNMSFFNHTATTTCGAFSNDGSLLISGSEDCSVRVYKLKDKCLLHTIQGKKFHQSAVTCLSVASSKSLVATGSGGNELALLNHENGNLLYFLALEPNEASIESMVFAFDDKYLVFADSANTIKIFDLSMLQTRAIIKLDNDNVTKMVLSMKKFYQIYASGTSGVFYIIDTRGGGSITMKEKMHSDAIMDFIVTRDENFALTSSLDKTINLAKIVLLN